MDARGDSKTSYYIDNLLLEKKQKYYLLLSLAQRKKQRNIHPYQTSPYIGRLKKLFAETVE